MNGPCVYSPWRFLHVNLHQLLYLLESIVIALFKFLLYIRKIKIVYIYLY